MNQVSTHFLSFTGNPLAETTFVYDTWSPGKTQRARSSSFQMGGKGINVSKMLIRLGARSTALTFAGGASGSQCEAWLKAQKLEALCIPTKAPTRSGLVIRATDQPETTFLGADSPPDSDAWQSAAKALATWRTQSQNPKPVLVFCGSSPGWANSEAAPFREEIQCWLQAGLRLYVDSYGPPLSSLCAQAVDLIKINADELRVLLERPGTVEALLPLALERYQAKAWIVSDGPNPVYLACRGEALACLQPPLIKEISATGSGDVLLAALLFAHLERSLPWMEALKFAIPLAAANAAHPGLADFPFELVQA